MDYSEMNVQQRAAYLMAKGVEAKLDIDPNALAPGYAAHVIGVGKLPCGYHQSEQAAIDAGTAWLRESVCSAGPLDRNVVRLVDEAEVAVLFARADSNYKAMNDLFGCDEIFGRPLPKVDVWDAQRDALRWPGGCPVVAHPPCRGWGKLRHMAKPRAGEKELALWAVEQVRRWGGVLEHPKGSTLWEAARLPDIEERDEYGGWTLEIHQHWWGHKAEKATRLYIVGCEPEDIPPIKLRTTRPTHVVSTGHGLREGDPGFRTRVTDAEREHTPPALAAWLVELAARCKTHNAALTGRPSGRSG